MIFLKSSIKISLLLIVAIAVVGCKSVPPINPLSDADSWDIGVAAAKVVAGSQEPGAGSREEKPDLSLTVPPSDKSVRIDLYRKPQTLKQRVKEAMSNTPAYDVKSDNQGVQARQPKKTVWWRWLVAVVIGLFILAAVVMAVAARVANFSPGGFVKKIFRRQK